MARLHLLVLKQFERDRKRERHTLKVRKRALTPLYPPLVYWTWVMIIYCVRLPLLCYLCFSESNRKPATERNRGGGEGGGTTKREREGRGGLLGGEADATGKSHEVEGRILVQQVPPPLSFLYWHMTSCPPSTVLDCPFPPSPSPHGGWLPFIFFVVSWFFLVPFTLQFITHIFLSSE